MLILNTVHYGYCHHCQRASVVGDFKVNSWKHDFSLCSICLEKFAHEILNTIPEKEEEK